MSGGYGSVGRGPLRLTEQQLTRGRVLLRECLERCNGMYAVMLTTVDGNPVVDELTRDLPCSKLSTMTSSLLALSETIARESQQRLCRFVILENSDGRVVCLRVNQLLMLTCISSKDSNLGMVLNAGQTTAQELAKLVG